MVVSSLCQKITKNISQVLCFVLQVLNLLIVLQNILSESALPTHREVPIFGVVDGVFIMGKIDELRVDVEVFNVDIVDLKTRRNKKPPSRAQKATHDLQVSSYCQCFSFIYLI